MKSKVLKFVRVMGLGLVLAAAGQMDVMGQERAALGSSRNSRMVGAWETTVTPRNCQTGEQSAPSFPGLITFNEGGTLAEYGANPATPFRTPGHGVWQDGWRGEDSFYMTFSFLPLTPAGVPVGRLRVTQTVDYNRYTDAMSSSGSFQLTNLAGIVIGSGCSTSTAVRFG